MTKQWKHQSSRKDTVLSADQLCPSLMCGAGHLSPLTWAWVTSFIKIAVKTILPHCFRKFPEETMYKESLWYIWIAAQMCLWDHRDQGGSGPPRLQRPREGVRELGVPSATLQGQDGLHPRGAQHRVSVATSRLALSFLLTVGTSAGRCPQLPFVTARKLCSKMLSLSPSGAHPALGPWGARAPEVRTPRANKGRPNN